MARSYKILISLVIFNSIIFGQNLILIDKNKLPKSTAFIGSYDKLKEIESYCLQPVPNIDWTFAIEKEKLSKIVRSIYVKTLECQSDNSNNGEYFLYLGLVAHYAYNLEVNHYFGIAEENYKRADSLSLKNDYRAKWFLAYHYIQSALFEQGMNLFKFIISNYSITNHKFWENYAESSYLVGMPRNGLMGLDSANKYNPLSILDYPYLYDIRDSLVVPNPIDSFVVSDLLYIIEKETTKTIISYPFGYKITVPSKWKISWSSYVDSSFSINFKTNPLIGNHGSITCNLLIFTKVADSIDILSNFPCCSCYVYNKLDQYDLKLNLNEITVIDTIDTLYQKENGIYALMTTFERNEPKNSSINLEEPISIKFKSYRWNYYRYIAHKIYKRFKGKIFYNLVFDCCKTIYPQLEHDLNAVFDSFIVE